jgi:hypothetical protein
VKSRRGAGLCVGTAAGGAVDAARHRGVRRRRVLRVVGARPNVSVPPPACTSPAARATHQQMKKKKRMPGRFRNVCSSVWFHKVILEC